MAAGGITAAAVWVDVIPSLKNSATSISREARQAGKQAGRAMVDEINDALKRNPVTPDADTAPAEEKLRSWHARMSAAIRDIKTYVDVDTGAATAKLLALSRIQIGTFGAAAAAQSLFQLAGAVAPAAGALGLIPGVAVAGGIAIGGLKVGLTGFGEALKNVGDPAKFAEAVAKLSPAARSAAVAVQSFVPQWTRLKNSVQDTLFAGVADSIRDLGAKYLPILEFAFNGIASSANRAVLSTAGLLSTPKAMSDISEMTDYAAGAFDELAGVVAPLTSMFLDFGVVGASFLPNLVGGATDLATRWAWVVNEMRQTGELQRIISGGLSVIGDLGMLVGNVFSIVASLVQASASSGTNLLSVLVSATGAAADFLNSAQGIALLEGFFRGTATALQMASPLFSAIGSALATSIIPAISAGLPVIGQALGSLAPAVAPLADLFAALVPLVTQVTLVLAQNLASAVATVAPLLTGLVTSLSRYPGLVAAVVAGFIGFGAVVGVVVRVGTVVGQLAPIFGAVKTALADAGGATTVLGNAFRFLLGPVGLALGLFAVMFTTNAQFRDAVFGLVAAVAGLAGQLVGALMPVLGAVIAAVIPIANTLATMLAPVLNIISGIITFLSPLLSTLVPVVLGILGAIRAWTIAQTILNFVLTANPIGVVVMAIAALVAGVIYAWQNFEWFRNIVTAAWDAIKFAVSMVWEYYYKPILTAIWTALQFVGSIFVWLWQSVIVPAWNAIGQVISWAWTTVIQPVLSFIGTALAYLGVAIATVLVTPFYLAWQAISAVVQWAWTTILQPIFNFIVAQLQAVGAAFTWFWQAVIVPVWNGITAAISAAWTFVRDSIFTPIMTFIRGVLAATWNWLWNGVIVPVWNGILAAINTAWQFIQNNVFNPIMAFIRGPLAATWNFLWTDVIQPVWNGIVTAIRTAWDIIQGIFNVGKTAVDAVGRAFQSVADWIGRAWATIREAAAAPIRFVVDIVYNNGIRPVWNGIAGLFGMAQLGPVNFARGGVLPGYSPGRDTIPAMLSEGEGILVPEAVRGLGPSFVGWANRYFSGGRSNGGPGTGGGYATGGIVPRFADGGIVDGIGDFFSGAASFFGKVFTDPAGAVRELFAGVVGDAANTPGRGGWTDAVKQIPGKVIDAVVKKAKEWVASLASVGGSGVGRWSGVTAAALGMMSQPQSLIPVVLRRMNQESGGNPAIVNNWDSNAKKGTPSVGLMQVIGPTYRANADRRRDVGPYIYGTSIDPLSNILASMHYTLRRYGSLPAGYNKAGGYADGGIVSRLYDTGGVLPAGASLAVNRTGGNEHVAVFTDRQWAALGALGERLSDLPGTLRALVDDLRDEVGTRLADGARSIGATVRAALETGVTRIADTVTSSVSTAVNTAVTAATAAAARSSAATGGATTSTPAAARPAPHPSVGAAKEMLAYVNTGGVIFEDLTWRGYSPLVRQWNDYIADAFYGPDGKRNPFTRPALQRFLSDYIARGGAFDAGGVAGSTGLLLKQTIRPERVLSPRQTAAFESLVPLLEGGAGIARLDQAGSASRSDVPVAAAAGGPMIGELHQHFHGDDNERLAVRELTHTLRVAKRGRKR